MIVLFKKSSEFCSVFEFSQRMNKHCSVIPGDYNVDKIKNLRTFFKANCKCKLAFSDIFKAVIILNY